MRICAILILALILVSCTTARHASQSPLGTSDYASPVSDPLEGFNRGVQAFNGGFNNCVVYPASSLYRFAAPACLRRGLVNFTKNLAYPVRALNNCFQGKFAFAWDETKRFGINTTIGVLGFGDPARDWWNIPEHSEDFGQTFAHYGVGPGCFVNLPLVGPSNVRDIVGSLLALPCNVLSWLIPDEAMYVNGGCMAVSAMEKSPGIRQFFRSEYDTYMLTRAAYEISRQAQALDFIPPDVNADPEESMGFMLLKPQSEYFLDWEYTHYIKLQGAQRKMPYSCWLAKGSKRLDQQSTSALKGRRRIMVILPGLGGHRLSSGVAALAELYVNAGWSVISFSSTMHPEVFHALPKSEFPGNLRKDASCMNEAVKCALEDFCRRHPRYAADDCSILGYSLGAMNALFMASENMPFACNRIIAVNPPRNPVYALSKIDEYFATPEKWGGDAEEKAHQLFLRIASILNGNGEVSNVPLTREESQFLIGLFMRLPLVDVIMARAKDGSNPLGNDKIPAVEDALSMKWLDYVEKVMLPQEREEDGNVKSVKDLAEKYSIGAIEKQVRDDGRIRLLHNKNDFLLEQGDIDWYGELFGERGTFLDKGGHLGNIFAAEYKNMLLKLAE